MATCSKCGEDKPVSEFHRDSSQPSGRYSACKSCKCAAHHDRYLFNPEKYRNKRRATYHSDLQKSRAESLSRYYKRKSSGLATQYPQTKRAWYLRNIESQQERGRADYRRKPDYYKQRSADRRAIKLRSIPIWADMKQVSAIYRKARQLTVQSGIPHHVDHIVPLNSRIVCGLHCEANLAVLTAVANAAKRNIYWPDMP